MDAYWDFYRTSLLQELLSGSWGPRGMRAVARMRKPTRTDTTVARRPAVLSVSPKGEDCASLERIFRESDLALSAKSDWTLVASPSLASAVSILRKMTIAVVVCESELFPPRGAKTASLGKRSYR